MKDPETSDSDPWSVSPLSLPDADEGQPSPAPRPSTHPESSAAVAGNPQVAIAVPAEGEQRRLPALSVNRVLGGLVLGLSFAAGVFLLVSHFFRDVVFFGAAALTLLSTSVTFIVLRGRLHLWLRERDVRRRLHEAGQQRETQETRF